MRVSSRVLAIAQHFMGEQFGIVSRRQLLDLGVPAKTIDSRVTRGHFSPVFTGQYMQTGATLSRNGLLVAALFKGGDTSSLVAQTAASVWGFTQASDRIEVLSDRQVRRETAREIVEGSGDCGLYIPRCLAHLSERHLTRRNGFTLTTVEATLGQLAADLPEQRFQDVFMEADRLDLINDQRLSSMIAWTAGRAGASVFREAVEDRHPDLGKARSNLEGMLLRLLAQSDLPRPALNVWVEGYLADFVWRDQRVIVETDGYQYHRGREKFERDAEVRNRLRSLGWTVLVYTYRMIDRTPERVLREIRLAVGHLR